MLDTYEGNAYISDMDTYELLYLNKTSCKVLGMQASEAVGRKCYEVIQGRTSPCPFCTNDRICEEEFYEWEFYNPTLKRTFMIKNRVVDWEGRRADWNCPTTITAWNISWPKRIRKERR